MMAFVCNKTRALRLTEEALFRYANCLFYITVQYNVDQRFPIQGSRPSRSTKINLHGQKIDKGIIKGKHIPITRMFNAGQDAGYYIINSPKMLQINLMAWLINIGRVKALSVSKHCLL